MTSRAAAFLGLLIGGVLALVASAQPWWRAGGEGASVAFNGNQASAGLTQAMAMVVLAGVLLALSLRARARRVVAAFLAMTGAGMVLVGVLRPRPTDAAVLGRLRQISLVDQFAIQPTVWSLVYAGGGALVAAGALVMITRAGHWPQRADRFARAGQPYGTTRTRPGPEPVDDALVAWQALDAGFDPTEDLPRRTAPAETPNVQSLRLGDTMGARYDSEKPPSPPEVGRP